jgi:hypothetical protein
MNLSECMAGVWDYWVNCMLSEAHMNSIFFWRNIWIYLVTPILVKTVHYLVQSPKVKNEWQWSTFVKWKNTSW